VEYGPDGTILEKDEYGNIIEYTKTGIRIPKDRYGNIMKKSIDE